VATAGLDFGELAEPVRRVATVIPAGWGKYRYHSVARAFKLVLSGHQLKAV